MSRKQSNDFRAEALPTDKRARAKRGANQDVLVAIDAPPSPSNEAFSRGASSDEDDEEHYVFGHSDGDGEDLARRPSTQSNTRTARKSSEPVSKKNKDVRRIHSKGTLRH